jgi:hypothetical protein
VSSSFGAYRARGRIVIVPDMRDVRGMTLTDTEALITVAADASDEDLGLAAIGILGHERQLDYAMDFRSEKYRQWNAANRKLICAAFGVKTVKSWLLPDATYVLAESANGVLTVTPWRRHGLRDAWVGTNSGPTETTPADDPAAIGKALKDMLAICLPPAR